MMGRDSPARIEAEIHFTDIAMDVPFSALEDKPTGGIQTIM